MKNKKFKNAVWMRGDIKFSGDEYESFTLVRIDGWHRLGFASNFNGTWHLSPDPACSMKDRKITHWLAVPKVPKA